MASNKPWPILALAVAVGLSACSSTSSLLDGKKIDYKSSGKLPPLEIPPDLTSPTGDDRFAVPDINPRGSATFSAYSRERSGEPSTRSSVLLPAQEKVTFQRAGSQRWLVVQAQPDEVWPVVRDFWQENGFIVNIERPESGVMETDWAENRAKIAQDPIRNVLGKVLDSLYSSGERDKFRTRLEINADARTEVYISHRGMVEVFEGGGSSSAAGTARTVWQPRPSDPELEAEMLRRLMVRFGVEKERAQTLLAADAVRERARLTRNADGSGNVALAEPFDRAWRRVGLALDRVGFTVEDRDRSRGLYFVRYIDPETDGAKEEKGFLSKLTFWKSDARASAEQYRIEVAGSGDNAEVRVLDKAGSPDKSSTAGRILNLLHEQLK